MGKQDMKRVMAELREYALAFPGAVEEFPWGERVVKVNKKVFVFLGHDGAGDRFGLSAKLPSSHGMALMLPFASPTGYGLGKAGWVTAEFAAKDDAPVDVLKEWIRESYLAVAPVKLARQVAGAAPATATPARAKPAPAKRASRPSTKAPAERAPRKTTPRAKRPS